MLQAIQIPFGRYGQLIYLIWAVPSLLRTAYLSYLGRLGQFGRILYTLAQQTQNNEIQAPRQAFTKEVLQGVNLNIRVHFECKLCKTDFLKFTFLKRKNIDVVCHMTTTSYILFTF